MGCVGRRGWGNSLIVALFALVLLGLSGVGERNSAAAVACTLWYDNNHVETYYDPLTGSCAPTGDPDTQVLISTYQGWIFHDFKGQVADTSDRPPCVFLVSDEGSAVPDEHLHFLLCSYPEDLNDQYGMTFQVRYAETSTTTAVNITFTVTCQYYTLIQCFGGTPATMTITGGLPKLSTAPASLPEDAVSVAYSQSLAVTGGVGTITYALTGTLPRGLSFDTATGVLSGTPTQAGTFPLSFTATDSAPAGSGGPQEVSNSQLSLVITGTTIPVPTTTTLAASINPAQTGQTITLTAEIKHSDSGQPVTDGQVDFTERGTMLCSAVVVQSGSATCDAVFNTLGLHSIAAGYTSPSADPSSGTTALTVTAPATGDKDAALVGGFQSDRATLIVSHLWNMARNTDRLNAAQGSPGSNGQAQFGPGGIVAGPQSLGASAITQQGPSDPYGLQAMLYGAMRNLGETGTLNQLTASGPINASISTNAGLTASFHTSLSQIITAQDAALGVEKSPGAAAPRLDVWMEGSYGGYGGKRSGQFGLFSVGSDYVLNPNLLLGIFAQIDSTSQTSGTPVSGTGWMAGPYATLRLTDNLFWQSRLAGGRSGNTLSGSGDFTSTRWLASSELDGNWALTDHLTFAPGLSFTYFQDTTEPYTNLSGAAVTGVKSELGELRFSPTLSYGFKTDNDLWVEPSLTPDLIWNFGSTEMEGLGLLPDVDAGPTGLRGRLRMGLSLRSPEGITLTATGAYDGIGAEGYSALSAQARLLVPLN